MFLSIRRFGWIPDSACSDSMKVPIFVGFFEFAAGAPKLSRAIPPFTALKNR
jgi:hypothetical protein